MSTPANALDVVQPGLVKFDGISSFTGVTVTNHDVLVGAASNGITSISPSTSGFALLSNGVSADPSFQAIANANLPGSGAVTLANGTNISVAGSPLSLGGTATISVSGPITPTSYASNGILYGNGAGAIQVTAQGAANTVLLGNGGIPSFGTVPNAALTNSSVTLSNGTNVSITGSPLSLGGTATINVSGPPSVTTLTSNGVVLGQGSSAMTATAAGTTNTVLLGNTGLAPTFGTVPNAALTNSSVTINSAGDITGGGSVSLGGTLTLTGSGVTTINSGSGSATASANAITITGLGETTTSASGATVSILEPRNSKWIVDPTANFGTHQTIASAISAASSGQTIFIRPGTYTENLTLKAGVSLSAFGCDSSVGAGNHTGNVIISGKATFTGAGTVNISGVQLQTNSDFFLAVTGASASVVNLNNCYLNCSNNTGISHTSSSSSSSINIWSCQGDIGTTGISLFTSTSAGNINLTYTSITNSGASSTTSTISTGTAEFEHCNLAIPFSTSSAGQINFLWTICGNTATNTIAFTTAGTGSSSAKFSNFGSGTSSAISVGAGTTVSLNSCEITSSNTNAITGGGTLNYNGLIFSGASFNINTTTQTGGLLKGGEAQAPSAGFIGEAVRSYVSSAAGVPVSNNTATNITNISLTAGIWDVSCVGGFNGTITGTDFNISISTTSATRGSGGDTEISTPTAPTSASNSQLSIPSVRLTLTSTTIVYLVAFASYTVGSLKGYGRISATRVG